MSARGMSATKSLTYDGEMMRHARFCACVAGTTFAATLLPAANRFGAAPYRLSPQPRGSLVHLKPQTVDTAAILQPHQVLLAVSAVGLNFRDVLNVLGMYPGDPGHPGGDFAGAVLAAGAAVQKFAPGKLLQCCTGIVVPLDAVIVSTAGSFTAQHVICITVLREHVQHLLYLHEHIWVPYSPQLSAMETACDRLPARAGDRVFGQAGGCLGSHVVADAASLVPLPCTPGSLATATLPTAHLTAAAALLDAAGVQAGDRYTAHRAGSEAKRRVDGRRYRSKLARSKAV